MEILLQEGLCMRNSDHITDSSSIAEGGLTAEEGKKAASSIQSETRDQTASAKSGNKIGNNKNNQEPSGQSETEKQTVQSERGKKHKIFTRILGVLIILSIVFGADYMASLSFDSVRIKDYYNYDIARLDKEDAKVDMILTGTSQVYRSCSPDVISEGLGIGEVIDCASALGTNNGTYYMLRDLFDRFDPKYVLIGLTWDSFIPRAEGGKLWGEMLIADRLPLMTRLEYVFTCLKPTEWMNLSAMYRFGGTIWGPSQILKNYRNRKAIAEGNWVDESKRIYRKNGYCWYNEVAEKGTIGAYVNTYSDDLVGEEEVTYVRKMIEMSREEGAEVILFTVPTPMAEIYSVDDYQSAVDYIQAFADEMDCEYLNFSYLKNREEILPDETFSDYIHMNGPGSEVFSHILADTLNMTLNGEDTSSLFYENMDDMKKDVHRIVSCNAVIVRNGDTADINILSHQNADITPEYRILIVEPSEDGSDGAGGNAGSAGENGNSADGEEKNTNAGEGNGDDDNVSEIIDGKTYTVVSELSSWKSDQIITVDSSLIPPGTTIRVEARQAGESSPDACYIVDIVT